MAEQEKQAVPAVGMRGALTRLLSKFKLVSRPASGGRDRSEEDSDSGSDSASMGQIMSLPEGRADRYRIFEQMSEFPLIDSILQLHAEEATQTDPDKGKCAWIESKHDHMVKAGDAALHNLQVEDRLAAIAYRVCRAGDEFRRTSYASGKGVLGWKSQAPRLVNRVDDATDRLVGFRQDGKKFRQGASAISWPWDYIHFRLLGKDEDTGHGNSVSETLYRAWKQLALAEDSILFMRVKRSPDRNAVITATGDLDDVEAAAAVNRNRKALRKQEFVSPDTPQYRKFYNPFTAFEDVFLSARNADDIRIEPLAGSGDVGQLFDLDHYRKTLFGAARVPAGFVGWGDEVGAKATLVSQDVRFARTIKRVQRTLTYGLRYALDLHYILLAASASEGGEKFNPANSEYLIRLCASSYLDELERLELMKMRIEMLNEAAQLVQALQIDPRVWAAYTLERYAKLPSALITKLLAKPAPAPVEMPMGAAPAAAPPAESREGIHALAKRTAERHNVKLSQLTEDGGKGYYELSEPEKRAIAEAIDRNPALRQTVVNLRSLYVDERNVQDEVRSQIDPSLTAPIIVSSDGEQVAMENAAEQLDESDDIKKAKQQVDALRKKGRKVEA